MAGEHGGARQGTPGKGYSNRTDLQTNMAPQTPTATASTGGVPVGTVQPSTGADQVPNIGDPGNSAPLTDGMPFGPGDSGPSAFASSSRATDPVRLALSAALLQGANPDIERILMRLDAEGR